MKVVPKELLEYFWVYMGAEKCLKILARYY
jgi:hypothetical protein